MLCCWARSLARLSDQVGPPAVSHSRMGLETVLQNQVGSLSRLPGQLELQAKLRDNVVYLPGKDMG